MISSAWTSTKRSPTLTATCWPVLPVGHQPDEPVQLVGQGRRRPAGGPAPGSLPAPAWRPRPASGGSPRRSPRTPRRPGDRTPSRRRLPAVVPIVEPAHHLEPGQSGHLNVEKQDVGIDARRGPERLQAVGGASDDLHAFRCPRRKQSSSRACCSSSATTAAGVSVHDASPSGEGQLSGISIRANVPSPGRCEA